MSPNMKMETTGGGIGKMFGRALSGDTLFQNIYTAERTNGMISIASSFPGSIKAFEITPGNEIILQNLPFLLLKQVLNYQCILGKTWLRSFRW